MVKLYHYTNEEGKRAIESTGFIRQSVASSFRDDAVYGDGVYLTSLGPENDTRTILGNNWDGRVVPISKTLYTEFYFEFDSQDDINFEQVSKTQDNRDIWILRGKNLKIGSQKAKKRNI